MRPKTHPTNRFKRTGGATLFVSVGGGPAPCEPLLDWQSQQSNFAWGRAGNQSGGVIKPPDPQTPGTGSTRSRLPTHLPVMRGRWVGWWRVGCLEAGSPTSLHLTLRPHPPVYVRVACSATRAQRVPRWGGSVAGNGASA